MTLFRLAHLSDPHLPPPPIPFRAGDLVSKRLLSRFAWRRKHRRHQRAVLDAMTADIAARAPDHIAITGDLTNFSTPQEYAAAAAWLRGLGDSSRITVSPGNHDALVRRGAPQDFRPWTDWLGDGAEADFPHVRLRGPVALINLSSAVATAPHSATGRLGPDQVRRAADALDRHRDRFRIVAVHHPPASGLVSARKSLTDAADLRAALRRVGAELILHGHSHEPSLSAVAGPDGAIPVLSAPSASTPAGKPHRAARWNEIEVGDAGEGRLRARVTVRGVTEGCAFRTLGSYRL